MQEADQFNRIAGEFQPKPVIADSQPVIVVKALNFFNIVKFIQRVDRFQFLDELKKPFLDAGIAGDGLKILQECFGV
jgi:hypothetical protein